MPAELGRHIADAQLSVRIALVAVGRWRERRIQTRVDSDRARVLVLSTPAGLERMVRDASVPAAVRRLPPEGTPRPTPEELERIFRAHGQVNLGPPLA